MIRPENNRYYCLREEPNKPKFSIHGRNHLDEPLQAIQINEERSSEPQEVPRLHSQLQRTVQK